MKVLLTSDEKLQIKSEASDEFSSLSCLFYQLRLLLFAALCNTYQSLSWKSKRYNDNEIPFGGRWFIVGIDTSEGPYACYYDLKYFDLFECKEIEKAPKWDGRIDWDIDRLLSLLSRKGKE